MNYKEIKKHNKAEQKKYFDSFGSENRYEPNYIDLIDYVFNDATNDEGMTIQHRICFHLSNPNGACSKLPVYGDFRVIDKPGMVCNAWAYLSLCTSYGYKRLSEMHDKKNVRKIDVDYALMTIYRDIEQAKKIMIEQNLVGKDTFAAEGVK